MSAPLCWLGSSFAKAYESSGGTWDPRRQHDSPQLAQRETALCCAATASQAESYWGGWLHKPSAYRCLPTLSHLSVPAGADREARSHRIGLFVVRSQRYAWQGSMFPFLLTRFTTSFLEEGNLINLAGEWLHVTIGLHVPYLSVFICLLSVCVYFMSTMRFFFCISSFLNVKDGVVIGVSFQTCCYKLFNLQNLDSKLMFLYKVRNKNSSGMLPVVFLFFTSLAPLLTTFVIHCPSPSLKLPSFASLFLL